MEILEQMTKSLSVVLITHNAQTVIEECLRTVTWGNEIIVLDNNSRDETRLIARRLGAQVYQSNDWPGFGIQRQRAQQYARGEYILVVDADERVTPELKASITEMLSQPDRANIVYACARKNFFLNTFLRYSSGYPDWIVRLYPRHYQYSDDIVHESLNYGSASVVYLTGDLHHLTAIDLNVFQQKQLRYAQDWAIQRAKTGKKVSLFSAFAHALIAFIRIGVLKRGFLEGEFGWLMATITAQYTFNKYAALWILQRATKKNRFSN